MYNYGYGYGMTSSVGGSLVWTIISAVIAVIGGITLYFVFLRSNKKYNNFLDKLRDFFNFKILLLEDILKVTYLILAIFITLGSFALIAVNFVSFLSMLIIGNLVLRILYEMSLLLIKICNNTSEINKKLK